MPPRSPLILALALCLPLVACAGSDGGETPTPGSDDAYAETLYDTFAQGQYEGWSTVPAEGASLSLSGDHSGNYVLTYANPTAAAALADWSGAMPEGGVLLKVQYEDEAGATLAGYTVMEKQEAGYAPDSGDWFWAGYRADGSSYTAGTPGGCIGCHTSGDDFIRTEF